MEDTAEDKKIEVSGSQEKEEQKNRSRRSKIRDVTIL